MLVLAAVPPHYPLFLPISSNSLDREGVRLLSPRDSQITSKNQLQVPMITVQLMQPGSRGSSMKIVFVVLFHFQLISSGAQSGDRGSMH